MLRTLSEELLGSQSFRHCTAVLCCSFATPWSQDLEFADALAVMSSEQNNWADFTNSTYRYLYRYLQHSEMLSTSFNIFAYGLCVRSSVAKWMLCRSSVDFAFCSLLTLSLGFTDTSIPLVFQSWQCSRWGGGKGIGSCCYATAWAGACSRGRQKRTTQNKCGFRWVARGGTWFNWGNCSYFVCRTNPKSYRKAHPQCTTDKKLSQTLFSTGFSVSLSFESKSSHFLPNSSKLTDTRTLTRTHDSARKDLRNMSEFQSFTLCNSHRMSDNSAQSAISRLDRATTCQVETLKELHKVRWTELKIRERALSFAVGRFVRTAISVLSSLSHLHCRMSLMQQCRLRTEKKLQRSYIELRHFFPLPFPLFRRFPKNGIRTLRRCSVLLWGRGDAPVPGVPEDGARGRARERPGRAEKGTGAGLRLRKTRERRHEDMEKRNDLREIIWT